MNKGKTITVFEHETLRFDKGEKRLSEDQFKALQCYYGEGVPYFDLRYNGVCFNSYVGVIQIGTTLIEVLPKADKAAKPDDTTRWRNILIGMLKAVGQFEIRTTGQGELKIRPNTILDLYFELFVKEIEYILRNGLVKKYHKRDVNATSLKGSLQFAQHIQHNLSHQERFFVRHSTYDSEHLLHVILYKSIKLLQQINTNGRIQCRINTVLLEFPEMPDIKVNDATFSNISYNRKTLCYKNAVDIAHILLLQYHPDVRKGRNHVLALMFDMNKLWEKFVFVSIRKLLQEGITVKAQTSKSFWKQGNGYPNKIRPDIVICKGDTNLIVDTKWKNLDNSTASMDDLRQMFVYNEYFRAKKAILAYPGMTQFQTNGFFMDPDAEAKHYKECSLVPLEVETDISKWQNSIAQKITALLD